MCAFKPYPQYPVVLFASVAVALSGCNRGVTTIEQGLHQRVNVLEQDLDRSMQELADRDAQIAILHRQIEGLRSFPGVELKDLFVVDRIELAKRTGGADYDGQPGDDGITVYLRPVDAAGDPIKAAGQVSVQLFDLAGSGPPRELATYVFDDRKTLAGCWYGGFLTNHYTFKCPFKPVSGQPVTREVQIRVIFRDWLTGRSHLASKTVEIERIDPENAIRPRGSRS